MEYIPNKSQSLKSLKSKGDSHLSKISETSHFTQCKYYYIINTVPHPFQTLIIILERGEGGGGERRGEKDKEEETRYPTNRSQRANASNYKNIILKISVLFFSNILLGFLSVIPTIRKGMQLGPVWNCLSDFFSWQISSQGS